MLFLPVTTATVNPPTTLVPWDYWVVCFTCIAVYLKFCRPKQVLAMSEKGGKGFSLLSKGGKRWTFPLSLSCPASKVSIFFSFFFWVANSGVEFFVRLFYWPLGHRAQILGWVWPMRLLLPLIISCLSFFPFVLITDMWDYVLTT